MRSVAIDTNGYTAFKRGDPAVVGVLRHAPEIFVGTTVLGELLAGFAAGSRENANRVELTRFLESPRVKQVSCGPATADLYARHGGIVREGFVIAAHQLVGGYLSGTLCTLS